jgi:tocopherol O-methyltransferase
LRSRNSPTSNLRRAVERHYDSLAFLYRTFWGEHIHHGLWLDGDAPPRTAQEYLVAHLAERAGIRAGERVLDVGCGYGASGRWLATHQGCPVTGFSVSRVQTRLAQRQNAKAGLQSLTSAVRADAASPPFADGSFDIVWVIECTEHLEDRRRFVLDAARLLRPGGRLALCAWQRGPGVDEDDPQVRQVCEAFLCPSLSSEAEYREWCSEADLGVRHADDLTPHVRATWEIVSARVGAWWLSPLRLFFGRDTRRFVDGFAVIGKAYESGAMNYGLLIAEKPG